jgi:hypothetical protein
MKFEKTLTEILAASKEKLEEFLAPARARQIRAKADLEIAKLEEKLLTSEAKVQTLLCSKEIDFNAVLNEMDEHDLTARRIAQFGELMGGLFPDTRGSNA